MGLFDKSNKNEEARGTKDFRVGLHSAIIRLEDSYIYFNYDMQEHQVFYKDIKTVKKVQNVWKQDVAIHIRTLTGFYGITPKRLLTGGQQVVELYEAIMEKMNEQNVPSPPNTNAGDISFCGYCGQKVDSDLNFCTSCGAKLRKN